MSEQITKRLLSTVAVCLGVVSATASLPAAAIDWSGVKENELRLFYPGETSLEWIGSKRYHDGAAKYKNRKNSCKDCHDGDEEKFGSEIVQGSESESQPLVGRRGFVPATLQAAYDSTDIHIRVTWTKTTAEITWPKYTDSLDGVQNENYDSRLTLMLDDGSIEEFSWGGCWALCHADEKQMSMGGQQHGDKQKYLAESRSEMHRKTGGGDHLLADAEIQKLINSGVFLEYWQAGLNPGKSVDVIEGTILKERVESKNSVVSVKATEEGDKWVVDFKRPLAGGPNHKTLQPGKTYTLGLALHDQFSAGRYHLSSLESTLMLGQGEAHIIAVKQ